MTRAKVVFIALPLLALAGLCAPLALPTDGRFQPIRHRYDSYRACRPPYVSLDTSPSPERRLGITDSGLRWWHLFGWGSRLRAADAYTWSWGADVLTPADTIRVAMTCTARPDSGGRWMPVGLQRTLFRENGRPTTPKELCAQHPEACWPHHELPRRSPDGEVTDAELLAYSRRSWDKAEMVHSKVVLGHNRGMKVIAEFPCGDVCPDATTRIIRYDVDPVEACFAGGGALDEVLVSYGIGVAKRQYCVPPVLAGQTADSP